MPSNKEIAHILESLADLLEIDQASPFRIRAYRNGADTIRHHDGELDGLVRAEADLTQLPDIGKGLAKTIGEIVTLGIPAYRAKLEQTHAPGLLEILAIPGLGPKRVRMLRDELGVQSPTDLRQALIEGRLREVPGFGPKSEERLLRLLDG
ncbi:MAG: hypothetical protein CMJ89_02795 [Planctomycetes bacterium]|jgi:DNA polymerase (family 10)|nr:hypothetical protein [Planctomycetota bacterium]